MPPVSPELLPQPTELVGQPVFVEVAPQPIENFTVKEYEPSAAVVELQIALTEGSHTPRVTSSKESLSQAATVTFHDLTADSARLLLGIGKDGEVVKTGFRHGTEHTVNQMDISFGGHGLIPEGELLFSQEVSSVTGEVSVRINNTEFTVKLVVEQYGSDIRMDILPEPSVLQSDVDTMFTLVSDSLKPKSK